MASLGKLVLIAGLAFLVLAAHDHAGRGRGGLAGVGGPAIGAAAAAPPTRKVVVLSHHLPVSAAVAGSKRVIPRSGPSNNWNSEVNREKPSSGRRRRTRAIDGRRLGFP